MQGLKSQPGTSLEQAEAIIQRLTQQKAIWIEVPIRERIYYLERCLEAIAVVAADWVQAACYAKGIDPKSPLAGEEWLIGPTAMITTLQAGGQPQPLRLRQRNGQAIAQVFPDSLLDWLLWFGFTGEVCLSPGRPITQGQAYQTPDPTGKLALVLGAGNVSAIAPLDALYKLIAENAVVLLKLNPVNDYLGTFLEQALAPLQEAGYLVTVYGDADLGKFLCQHPLIDTIHITGSHRTYEAILHQRGSAFLECRKLYADHLAMPKPITAELGCVTPVLVIPGNWSDSDLAFQARHVASMVVHNASFNCAAAKVLITAKGWAQRDLFLDYLRRKLAQIPLREAYYPGATARYQTFLEHYPQAQTFGERNETTLPWMLIPNVPAQLDEHALREEAFCGVLAEVSLQATDAAAFLNTAVAFANQQVWGNLSCTVLIDGATQRQYRAELETAIAQLRYGAIGINLWSGVIFGIPACTWGAFPGNTPKDIQSGQGVVHNAYLFDHPQKSVVRAPFRIFPTPPWFAQHRTLREMAIHYTQLQAQPSFSNLLKVFWAAIRG
jgi:acyl-CoA reductase-like NAD-dependent aldehyde dehydrogenase